jgi:hypothetical protein
MLRSGYSVLGASLAFVACGSFQESPEATPLPERDAGGSFDGGTDAVASSDGEAGTPQAIYVFGGNAYDVVAGTLPFTPAAYRAVIATDGTLSAWEPVSLLDLALAGASFLSPAPGVAVAAGGVPEVSGARGGPTADVRSASTIVAWAPAPPLPARLLSPAGTVIGDLLVIAGGVDETGNTSTAVFTARYDAAAGGVAPWTNAGALGEASAFGAMTTLGPRIYMVGGQTSTVPNALSKNVWWTTARADGSIEPWNEIEPLPMPSTSYAFGHSLMTVGSRLVVVGGTTAGNSGTTDAFVGDAAADGSISWKASTPAPFAARLSCAVVVADSFYVLGGRDTDSIDSVARGTLQPSGAITWSASRPLPSPRDSFGCLVR